MKKSLTLISALVLSISSLFAQVPVPSFTSSPACPVAGSSVSFTNTSTNYIFDVWRFGDPTSGTRDTSTAVNSTHTFQTAGTYTVTLFISNGVVIDSVKQQVTVLAPLTITPASDTICGASFTPTTLTASGAQTYIWSTGAFTPAINVTPTASTTYTVTATYTGGCTATDSVHVIVSAAPTVTITPPFARVCSGTSTLLTATGTGTGLSYAWSDGKDSAAITVSPTVTTTYTVTVTNASGCTATASRTVTVTTAPNAGITPATDTICAGTNTTLTATGGTGFGGYAWSTGANTAAINVAPVATTTYTVTVTAGGGGGCTASASRTVVVKAAPVATINPASASICVGGSATLSAAASAGNTYAWSNFSSSDTITVSPVITTPYTLTVTGPDGCTATASATVTVNLALTVNISPANPSVCPGNTDTLVATAGNTYIWSTGATTRFITSTPTAATTYTVTVSDGGTCTGSATTLVSINPVPTAAITPSTDTVCSGGTARLTASGGTSYLWSTGAATAVLTVNPTATTAYTVTVTNATGCTATASINVVVTGNITAAITPVNDTVCGGTSVTLTATGGGTYAWSSGQAAPAINVTPATTTTYTVTASAQGGCTATASAVITVKPAPAAAIAPAGGATICSGQSVTLVASGIGTYAWSTGVIDTFRITVSPTITSVYSVTVTGPNGCTASATERVTVNATPTATITPASPAICLGQSQTLTAGGGGGGGNQYAWSNGGATPAITVTPTATTTYTLTVTNFGGCSATSSATVTVNSVPVVTIVPPADSICSGQTATLIASATGVTGYSWSTGSATQAVFVTPTTNTNYTVTVTNANNCTASASASVVVNALPVVSIAPGNTAICVGNSATLTASGGVNYVWSNGGTTAAITVSPTTTTTYYVTATNATGCTATDSVTVIANPLLTPVITPSNPVLCLGDSISLSVTAGVSYTWSTGATTQNITVSPTANTTYAVTATNGNGCSGTASVNVTVANNPVAAINPPVDSVCTGSSASLTASGGTSYVWSTGSDSASISVSPVATATYKVTVTNGSGCSATDSVVVKVNPKPAVTINPPFVTVCSGSSTTLTTTVTGVTGTSTFAWSSGSDSASTTVSPTATTLYTVTVTSASGCTATASRNVTVNPVPVVTITPATDTICSGTNTTLTASGGGGGFGAYRWSAGGPPGGASITVAPTATTTYYVTVTNGGGPGACSATDSVKVVVKPVATAAISPATVTVCAGTSATLTASGGGTYAWNTGSTIDSIVVTPTGTTTYTVTITGANGCTATANRTVNVNPAPVVTVNPATSSICTGNPVTLTATVAGPGFGNRYVWSTAAITAAITVSPTATTTYVVTVTGNNNCSATASAVVIADSTLVPIITPSNPTSCAGSPVALTVTAGTTYAWSNGAGTRVINVSPTTATTYTVTVTNGVGCSGTASVNVSVNPAVTAMVNPSAATICAGSSTSLSASGGTSYVWSTGNDSATITVAPGFTTTYRVTVSDSAGCSATASATVTVNRAPVVNITPPNAAVCAGSSVTLTAVSGGGGGGTVTYLWSTGSTAAAITVSPVATATYTVTATNASGCTATASCTVTVNPLPTAAITPAADTVCAGSTATLTASGAAGGGDGGYRWSTGGFGATINVTPTATTTYTVTVTGAGGCTAVAISTVLVKPAPAATVTPAKDTICGGSSVVLTASGGGTYAWSNNVSTAINAVSPTATTTYNVTVTGSNGCSATAAGTVTVNTVNAAIAPAVSSLCTGQSDTLVASGGTTYLWSNGSSATSIIITPASSGSYSVTVSAGNNCSASATASVSVNATLVPVITPASSNICFGGVATLTVSPGNSYQWSNNLTTQSIVVAPSATTTYTVTVSNGVGCSGTANVTVNVSANPTPTITPATVAICRGQSTVITAAGGTAYVWSTGSDSASITVSPAATTAYKVTVSNAAGCSATATRTVTVNPLPFANINPPVSNICPGANATLTAFGGTTYIWSTGATTAAITVSPVVTTPYTVTVTNATGCTATASRTVTITPVTATITPTTDTVCGGTNVTFTATGGGGGFGGYRWSTGAGGATITVAPTTTTTYTVTVTNGAGCTATASGIVTVLSATASITPAIDSVCSGSSTTLTANAGSAYAWSNGIHTQTATVSPTATTTYTVTVTNSHGCSATASRTVVVKAKPTVSLAPGVDTICGGHPVTITAVGTGTYSWSSGATTAVITVTPTVSTNYVVTLTSANGCTVSSTSDIVVRPVNAVVNPAVSSLCTGQSDTLSASGGGTYAWSNGSTATTIIVSPASTTTYTVTVNATNGCSATASGVVNINGTLSPVITPSNPAICPGSQVTLIVTAGGSYTWSNTDNTQSITVSPTASTTYTVTVTNGGTCSGTASVNVTVNSVPVAAVNPSNGSICSGLSATLTASGGISYQWNNTDTGAVVSVSPSATTTYTVTVTNSNGCTATATGTVNVVSNPNAGINPNAIAICSGSSTTLTATGGGTYNWSNSSTASAVTVSPVSTTTYLVTVTGNGNCTATASAVVTVNNAPVAAININTNPICNGQSDTLNATGGVSYVWSSGSNADTISVTPTATTTYTVTITGANSCTATASASLTVNSLPGAAVTPASTTICLGSGTTLTASGGASYNWSNNNAVAVNNVNPSVTTLYTVTVTGANGCSATASGNVVVNNTPSIFINPASTSICAGGSVTLYSIGGVSYSWSNSSIADSINAGPASSTTYSVTGIDANGCSATASASVTVNSNPVASVSPAADTICRGSSVTLTATGVGAFAWSNNATTNVILDSPTVSTVYTVTVTNTITGCSATASSAVVVDSVAATINPAISSICTNQSATITAGGGGTYAWSNGSTTATVTVTPLLTTTYTVTITAANHCVATESSTVDVNPFLIPVISPSTPAVCSGNSVTLGVTAASTYHWSTGATTQTISPSPTVSGPYSVTVSNLVGCSGTASVNVTVNTPPTTAITPNTISICDGQSTILSASGTGLTYAWSNNAGDTSAITVSPASTTTYSVTATDNNSCTATASSVVTVNSLPVVTVNPANDTICAGQQVSLTASAGVGATFTWSTGATTSSISQQLSSTTPYTVTATLLGCTATGSALVTVNAVPTADIDPDTISICNTQSATFTAFDSTGLGNDVYHWSNGSSSAVITVSPSNNTTYTVTITSNNCSATASALLIVNSLPVASISPSSGSVCSGLSTTLTSSLGTGGYAWSDGSTTGSITVSPTAATAYTVTVTNAAGCSATASALITVNTPPVASVNPTSVLACSGSTTTISASGAAGFAWSNGSTTSVINVNPTATATYDVTVTDGNGCTGSAASTVNVDVFVTSINPAGSTICVGTNDSLTASGGIGYLWSNGGSTAVIAVSPTANTTYTVTATDVNGCTATASAVVNTLPAPHASVNPVISSICTGQSTTLKANGGGTYAWSNGSTFSSTLVSPTSTTTYIVTVTGSNSCTATAQSTVVVNTSLVPIITPANPSVCLGSTLDISVTSGTTYTWSNGDTVQTIGVSPLTNTTYTVTVSIGGSCSGTASVNVAVNSLPVVNFTPASSFTICAGQDVNVTANGGVSYLWTSGSDSAVLNIHPSASLVDTVIVTDANGCKASGQVDIIAIQPSVSNVTAGVCVGGSYNFNGRILTIPGTYTDTLTATIGCDSIVVLTLQINGVITTTVNASICQGGSYSFKGQNLTTAGTYIDSLSATGGCDSIVTLHLAVGVPSTGAVTASFCADTGYTYHGRVYNTSGTYLDTLVNASGCDSIVTLNLTALAAPVITWNVRDTICNTVGITSVAIPAATPAGGVYSGTGVSGNTLNVGGGGTGTFNVTYTVQGTSSCNGVATKTFVVEICLGVDEPSLENAVQLYPNPANEMLTMQSALFTSDNQVPVIHDVTGKVIEVGYNRLANKFTFNTERLAAGVYFVEISIQGTTISKKFVKVD